MIPIARSLARRSLAPLLALSLLAGCEAGALPGPAPDGGSADDGATPPPDPLLTCDQVARDIYDWLDGHRSCATDADCAYVPTACGLPDACGAYANRSAEGSTLDGLVTQWEQRCDATDCACPAIYPDVACNQGVCGPRTTPPPAQPFGAPCASDTDCAGGRCLVDTNGRGSYCTRACTPPGPNGADTCPAGSRCHDSGLGDAATDDVCLLQCSLTDGAGPGCPGASTCCSGPGPTTGAGYCVPPNSFLCGAF